MKNSIVSIIGLLVIAGLIALSCVLYFRKEKKAVYILNDKVFAEYAGTKEIAAKVKATESTQKASLDSIYQEIQLAEQEGKPGEEKVRRNKALYDKVYSGYVNANQRQSEKYNEVLWKQINGHISTYGKSKGYAFVYGASGNGSIMYADTTLNVTDEVLWYINKKYAGE